jgi:hypothetical protein
VSEAFAVTFKADFRGQMQKSAILKNVPRAFKRNATGWATETVLHIKRSYKGGMTFKRPPKDIDQRLGQRVVTTSPETAQILIGTGGYIGRAPVVYAKIQDEGGTIKPKGHPYLTIPLPGVKGTIENFPGGFFFKSKKGNLLYSAPVRNRKASTSAIMSRSGEVNVLRPLFVLKRSVTLPARHWFTGPINQRRPILDATMTPDAVWLTATALADQGRGGS